MASPLSALIPRLRALLATGFMPAVDDDRGSWPLLRSLAHRLEVEGAGGQEDGKAADVQVGNSAGWIVSQRLLAVRPALASDAELLCALLAQQTETRAAWLAIAAARCREAGQMADGTSLVELVSGLGNAAAWVEAALANSALHASPHAAFERELLGVSFEQAAATPALVRILAVAAQLAQFEDVLPALPRVDASGMRAQQNWVKGRLLALPLVAELSSYVQKPVNAKPPIAAHGLLQGSISPVIAEGQSTMSWVLAHPWALLLTMLGYAQDAWRAENRGGLLLELPAGQNAWAPAEIAVTVIGAEGDELRCGSLADVVLKTLTNLGVSCFPFQPTTSELNAQLSPLVGLLLRHSVWRYQDGASSQLGQYQIHPQFSDQCYSLPASRVFNRTGRLLWQAARLSAQALFLENKQDQQNQFRRLFAREAEPEYAAQGGATHE